MDQPEAVLLRVGQAIVVGVERRVGWIIGVESVCDLVLVGHPVAVGVRVQWVGAVYENLRAVGQPIVIGIRVVGRRAPLLFR